MKRIKLTQNKYTIVDDDDYKYLNKFKWQASKNKQTFYAIRGRGIKMHRIIMNTPPNLQVDHINGDGLDNRKINLRNVDCRSNSQNLHVNKTSKYPGVSLRKDTNKWRSYINIKNKQYNLGCYDTELKAHRAYQEAVILIETGSFN